MFTTSGSRGEPDKPLPCRHHIVRSEVSRIFPASIRRLPDARRLIDRLLSHCPVTTASTTCSDLLHLLHRAARAREGYSRAFADSSIRDFPLTIRHENGALTEVKYNA
jgi:hypothetical protein